MTNPAIELFRQFENKNRGITLRSIAERYHCDVAAPCATGVGDVIMHTRVVEELAMHLGRPLKLLTSKLEPKDGVGTVAGEEPYPIWKANPFIDKIVDTNSLADGKLILEQISENEENHCHFGHIMANMCAQYGLVPRKLQPALYLTESECREALNKLSSLPRPVLCIHPYGTSSPLEDHPWYKYEWLELIKDIDDRLSIIEVGLSGKEDKGLPTKRFPTTIREMMALIWASDIFLGFDSSCAHVATAFSKPAMVLWEPIRKNKIEEQILPGFGLSAFARWSYPQNRNVMLLGETNGEIRRMAVRWMLDCSRSTRTEY